MISPLVATQASTPIASIQQNADAQSILHSQNALHETQEQEREVRETVVQKEEAAYYEQSPDAKEEGKNKYQNLYSGKKKKTKTEDTETHTGINACTWRLCSVCQRGDRPQSQGGCFPV